MGRIDDDDLLRVTRASDIVQVIQSYLGPLKRTGASYKALCPFHEEKTPSFTVSPAKQMYYCFGCHKGGDVIHFVMSHERLDFPEAVRLLADRAGIPLREAEGGQGPSLRKQVVEVNEWAAGLFQEWLRNAPEGQAARDYVTSRSLSPESARDFRLGFALPAWDRLLAAGRARGYAPELLEKAGLVVRRQEGPGHYDRFRNRLMFPIVDPRRQVIGFGARSLDGSEPKYLNSPETPLFSKGRALYGLDVAKESAAANRRLYVVEGYTDVIMACQHGVEGLVATLGTALTPDHLALLRRYAETVVLVYDGDEAGVKASERSSDLLLSEEVEIRVARLPAGEDPCDTLLRAGAGEFRRCLETSRELFEFVLAAAVEGRDLREVGDRTRAADGVIGRIARVPNAVRREMLVQRTAAAFGVSEASVRSRLAALGAAGGSDRRPAAPAAVPSGVGPRDPEETLGEELLSLAFFAPHLLPVLRERVPVDEFPGTGARRIASKMYARAGDEKPIAAAEVAALLQEPALAERVAAIIGAGEKGGAFEERFQRCLDALARRREQDRRQALQQEIRTAQSRGDAAAVARLLAEYDRLLRTVP